MAIIVIRVRPKMPKDLAHRARAERDGDVIEAVPDDWGFSPAELAHPDWRFLRLPGVTLDEARTFLAPGRVTPGSGRIAPFRLAGLDLAHPDWPAPEASHLADDRRIPPIFDSALTYADLQAMRSVRIPQPQPGAASPDRRVIGA